MKHEGLSSITSEELGIKGEVQPQKEQVKPKKRIIIPEPDRKKRIIESDDSDARYNKKLKEEIAEAKDFEELLVIIQASRGIQGSEKFYLVRELLEIIYQVRTKELTPDYLTNSCGLRDKVKELLEKNRKRRIIVE